MSLVLDEHRRYLADAARLAAYEHAIAAVVQPGDVVLDLAAGTGILGFLACRAGAARVYSVDGGPIVQIGRALAAANGFSDRVTFIRGYSPRIDLPERADVLVCDQVGHMGFEAGLFEYIRDARRRLLKPDARMVPQRIDIEVAPLESEDLRSRVDFWDHPRQGLDVSTAATMAVNTGYPAIVRGEDLLSSGEPIASAAIAADPQELAGEASCLVRRAARLDGICAWFRAELAPGISMTNHPAEPRRIDRRCVMLPIRNPVEVMAHDTVFVRMHIIPADHLVTWSVQVRRDEEIVARFRHTTFAGMLLTAEDVQTADPEWMPRLTAAGIARQHILDLCDGSRRLSEIEQLVFDRHRALLPTAADAAAFVAEVVSRYCELDADVPTR